MNKTLLCTLVTFLFFLSAHAQDNGNLFSLALEDVVQKAKAQSTAALAAETQKKRSYWMYRSYLSEYRPRLVLSGELPNFTRNFEPITQEDGSIVYQPVSQNSSSLSLSASQSIGYSGTNFFVRSSVFRFDDFDRDVTRYSGNPVEIGFNQPLFQFNDLRWNRVIEPLRYEESQKEYVEQLESIAIEATDRFFDLLLAQVNLENAQKNVSNNDTIYRISQGRYNLGKIAENELLQTELNLMNSRQEVAQAELDAETSTLRLKSFIGFNESQGITLELPNEMPDFPVDEAEALQQARANRSDMVSYDRQLAEAEAEVAQQRGNTGLNANLEATFGFTNRADNLPDLYVSPDDQQTISIGFFIPIVDWGRQKSRIKTAEAFQELTQYTVAQERINFEQEVLTKVRTFKMLRSRVAITEVADDIAARSYNIAYNRYLIGKISIADLDRSMDDKDQARAQYIQSLNDFWLAYYELRQLTLYDFEAGTILLENISY
jgi:outer membrane protein